MKKNFLTYSIIIGLIYFILKIILNNYNLDFIYSINLSLFFIIYITAVAGLIQITKKSKTLLIITTLITIIISCFIIIGVILSYRTVNIITIENQKVVEEIYGIPDPMAYQYKYINAFLKSYNTIKPPIKKFNSENSETQEEIIMKFHNSTVNTNIYHYD